MCSAFKLIPALKKNGQTKPFTPALHLDFGRDVKGGAYEGQQKGVSK